MTRREIKRCFDIDIAKTLSWRLLFLWGPDLLAQLLNYQDRQVSLGPWAWLSGSLMGDKARSVHC